MRRKFRRLFSMPGRVPNAATLPSALFITKPTTIVGLATGRINLNGEENLPLQPRRFQCALCNMEGLPWGLHIPSPSVSKAGERHLKGKRRPTICSRNLCPIPLEKTWIIRQRNAQMIGE